MIVIWTPEAEQDRADIWDYIVADNPGAAVHMDELFSGAAEQLAAHPKMGKAGRVSGTRELIPHENYCLIYEIDGGHCVGVGFGAYRPAMATSSGINAGR